MRNPIHSPRFLPILALILPLAAWSSPKPPKGVIPMAQARKLALETYKGDIKDEELEFENNQWVYSFDLKSADDSKIHEVQIDALSGKLVSQKTETPAEEKAELKAEKAGKAEKVKKSGQ